MKHMNQQMKHGLQNQQCATIPPNTVVVPAGTKKRTNSRGSAEKGFADKGPAPCRTCASVYLGASRALPGNKRQARIPLNKPQQVCHTCVAVYLGASRARRRDVSAAVSVHE